MDKVKIFFQKIWHRIRYWLWTKPVSRPEPVKAVEVEQNYIILEYHGQRINLKKSEVRAFHALSRKDKRAMAKRFETMEKKGQIRFEEINGKLIAIKNLDYAAKNDIRQSRLNKIRQG